jgi:cytidine deaminase
MEKLHINIDIVQYRNLEELENTDKNLVIEAKKAVKSAYAPYSGFNVGAAVLLENGEIITGTNQENSAYPSGLCAERVALFYANSRYPDVPVVSLAICAFYKNEYRKVPTAPCGSCRQVMIETETRFKKSMKVILYGTDKILVINNAKSLLPLSFSGSDLE